MSGHKRTTITLSQEEYRKLHEAEMRLRFMNELIPDPVSRASDQINEQLQSNLAAMQYRQKALLDSINQVNLDLVDLERNTSQALIEQQYVMQNDLVDVIDNYQVGNKTALESLETEVQSQLHNILDVHNQEWYWMMNEWQQRSRGIQHKDELAEEWIQAANIIDHFIAENYDHERFAPGVLPRLENRLTQAHNNLTQNLTEAAIAVAQEVYNELSELRILLEKQQIEFEVLLEQIGLKTAQIESLFKQNRIVPALDLEGNQLAYSINVDYWSDGQFNQLEQEFTGVISEMVNNPQPASNGELGELVKDYFPCVEDKIADIIFNARMKVINAQLRMNIAEIVVQALNGQGYALDDSFFLSGDERAPYQANMFNYEGSQVVVKVDPVSDLEASNELHLYTSDSQNKTSHELKQRALEIRRAIQSNGLEVGTILASKSTPDPGIFQSVVNESEEKTLPDTNKVIQPIQKRKPQKKVQP